MLRTAFIIFFLLSIACSPLCQNQCHAADNTPSADDDPFLKSLGVKKISMLPSGDMQIVVQNESPLIMTRVTVFVEGKKSKNGRTLWKKTSDIGALTPGQKKSIKIIIDDDTPVPAYFNITYTPGSLQAAGPNSPSVNASGEIEKKTTKKKKPIKIQKNPDGSVRLSN